MPVFALLAVITFALAFLLTWLGNSVEPFSLLYLGLLFVALHLLTGWSLPWRQRASS